MRIFQPLTEVNEITKLLPGHRSPGQLYFKGAAGIARFFAPRSVCSLRFPYLHTQFRVEVTFLNISKRGKNPGCIQGPIPQMRLKSEFLALAIVNVLQIIIIIIIIFINLLLERL
jgi:hypothetical protein